ncbi:flagellar biosynthesis protein FlgH, partial [Pseudoalteromonas sp. S1688]
MRNIMLFAVGTLLISGCVSTQNNEVVQAAPYSAPMYPEPYMESVVATGSLFSRQLSTDLYADKKALITGDIITGKLQESTHA